MRILFAAPDRDLLECYKKLMESDFGETVTAFDGTQVYSLMSAEKFDIVIIDSGIPRVDCKKLLLQAQETCTPVILLTEKPVRAGTLTDETVSNEYLVYPFAPAQVVQTVRGILEKAASGERLHIDGMEINVPEFRIAGGPRLTSKEIDVVRTLLSGGIVSADDGPYVSALNSRFASVGSNVRIKYGTKKGFELVTEK
ncbi:MAG: hypothetical protein IKX92_03810 [Clostridia bacterium]|nr:hypothetical protein [Clostridia bacterium]